MVLNAAPAQLGFSQPGRQFAFEELEKPVLVRADLGQDDVILAGADVMIDRFEIALS